MIARATSEAAQIVSITSVKLFTNLAGLVGVLFMIGWLFLQLPEGQLAIWGAGCAYAVTIAGRFIRCPICKGYVETKDGRHGGDSRLTPYVAHCGKCGHDLRTHQFGVRATAEQQQAWLERESAL
jgi:hypothetical protein